MDAIEIIFFIYMIIVTFAIALLHFVQLDIKADISNLYQLTDDEPKEVVNEKGGLDYVC